MQAPARPLPATLFRDLARAITAVENGYANVDDAIAAHLAAYPEPVAPPYVIGITGPPGAGKSTLVDALIERLRARGQTVAIIAVDPSSPFTKGAVLGDRVRMQRHASDPGVFIRSMASREAGGGLAPTSRDALTVVSRAGFDVAIVETVGVGQVELEIVALADTIAVVVVPGLGDGVQTIKAGLMEIADLFIVNMADRPGANAAVVELAHLARETGRNTPILRTVATTGDGLDALVDAFDVTRSGAHTSAARAVRFDVLRVVRDRAVRRATQLLDGREAAAIFADLESRTRSRAEARIALLALLGEEDFDAH
jgi:LAO/AO transport system kinase